MSDRQHPVMTLLTQSVPLTLLWDLRFADCLDSRVIYLIEEPTRRDHPITAPAALN